MCRFEVDTQCQMLKGAALDRFLLRKHGRTWDSAPLPGPTVADLDAAALMFHPEPQRFFTGAYLKIGYFETNVDLRYQDEVAGDLIFQVNQAL
jgi:ATP-dependent DNA helicase RecG